MSMCVWSPSLGSRLTMVNRRVNSIDPAGLRDLLGNIDIYLFDQLHRGRLPPGCRIVDAGCGGGRNLVYFMAAGYSVMGFDPNPEAISAVRGVASRLAPGLPADAFRVGSLENSSFDDGCADVVICNAVLHFAEDHQAFRAQLDGAWRLLAPGGLFFARLASNIGLEGQVVAKGQGRFVQPDGAERYLVSMEQLFAETRRLSGRLLDPIKTTQVQGLRSMTTWVLEKSRA